MSLHKNNDHPNDDGAPLPRIISERDDASSEQNDPTATCTSVDDSSSMHWILHWDINETILVGDEVGGDTIEDCFNKIIAKSAFVQKTADNAVGDDDNDFDSTTAMIPTHWWDGSPLKDEEGGPPPPLYTGWDWPKGCCPYYRTSYKRISKTFTDGHGAVYKPLYKEIEQRLTRRQQPDLFDNIIPAFFHTMNQLIHSPSSPNNPPVTIVFRTFGTDLPSIAQAMTAFAQGKHPDYPDFVHPQYELDASRLYYAKWVLQDHAGGGAEKQEEDERKRYQYQLFRQDDGSMVASGDQQVLDLLHNTGSSDQQHYVFGIQDDYPMWKAHTWEPWAGKPVWKLDGDSKHHHILLDDNIHNLPHDGIASVRQPTDNECFESLSGPEIQSMHGVHLIRVPTIEPIMNTDWFLQQIAKVQAAALLARASTGTT